MTQKRNAAGAAGAPPSADPAAAARSATAGAAAQAAGRGEAPPAEGGREARSEVGKASSTRGAKRKEKAADDHASASDSSSKALTASRDPGVSAPFAKKQRTQPPGSGRPPLVNETRDASRWRDALRLYPRILERIASGKRSVKDKEKLLELDHWFQDELPAALVGRASEGAYMTGEELSRLMQWKLSRGTFRPKLQQMVDGLDPKTVLLVTRQAFSFLAPAHKDNGSSPDTQKVLLQSGSFRKALEILTGLSGVGPATASAPYYMRYATAIWEKACELNEGIYDPSAVRFTAHDVEKALWSDALSQKFGIED